MRVSPVLFVGALLVACGSQQQQQQQPQPQFQQQQQFQQPQFQQQPTNGGASCGGVRLFQTPACQASLDQVCCSLESDCGADRACAELSACILSCKGRGDNCTNGCGVRAPPAALQKWIGIANCSKGVKYPPNVTCNDNT